jgi:HAD superfamily hydrolase (TIGR01509 family)
MSPALRYDLVIFDCDGVLIDSELLSCNALVDCLRRNSVEIDVETALDRFLGRSPKAISDYCALLNHILPDDFFPTLRLAVRTAFAAELKAIPDASALLGRLRPAYCVASSSTLDRLHYSLELTGLLPLFAGRIFSAEMVKRGKPAPDLFLHASAKMGFAPARSLVIEDSASGVQAAKAAGMSVWGFVGGSHYAGRDGGAILTAAGADRILERMADFRRHEPGLIDAADR